MSASVSTNGFKDAFSAASEAAKVPTRLKAPRSRRTRRRTHGINSPRKLLQLLLCRCLIRRRLCLCRLPLWCFHCLWAQAIVAAKTRLVPRQEGVGLFLLLLLRAVEARPWIWEDKNDASIGADLSDDEGAGSIAASSLNQPVPSEAVGTSGTDAAAKQVIEAAKMPAMTSASNSSQNTEDGATAVAKNDTAKSRDSDLPDATTQSPLLATTLPSTIPAVLSADAPNECGVSPRWKGHRPWALLTTAYAPPQG